MPDASPGAGRGAAGRHGALAGRGRRASALVFCASLAAALLLGASGSAEAQDVLVSNLDQSASTTGPRLGTTTDSNDAVQLFTTGTNTTGYTLASVELQLAYRSSGHESPTVKVHNVILNGSAVTLGAAVATLTAPSSTVNQNNFETYTAPAGITLATSITYGVFVEGGGNGVYLAVVNSGSGEETTSAVGWSIGDHVAARAHDATGVLTIGSGEPALLQVNGTAKASTNNPPTVANTIPDQPATVGTAFSYAFPANTFSDADTGDTLSYTATKADDTALPTWLAFAASTRTFSGTPQAADIATVAVKVTASDGTGGSVSDEFDIVVAAAGNNAPTVANTIPDQTATVGTAFSYVFPANTFSDADTSDTLTYTATKAAGTDLPLWLAFAASTRTFSGTPTDAGMVALKVTASDGNGGSVSDEFDIVVAAAGNNAPTVANTIPDQTATAGTAFSYVFPANTFSDADTSDTLTYTATKAAGTDLPLWLAFAASTRTFSGTPTDVGTVSVKVTASDGNGGSVSDTFDITVSAAGDTTPPTLTSATVFEGGVFINLQFSENMLQSNLPSTDTFTVTAAGSAVTVYTVQAAVFPAPLNAFWILVRPTIQQGQVVVVTYTDPTAGDDANAIQNTAGNDAATFTTGMDGVPAVTNNSITNTPATGAPTITGTATVGQTLTAGTTAIMDADGLTSVSYTYQWIRVATDNTETNIASATASTYTLVAADQGTTIKVTVSFTDDLNNPEARTSAATAAVSAAPNTPATGAPAITGTAQVGQTLTADTTAIVDADGLTNVSYTYQWIRVDGGTETNIASATASTYTLVAADQGKTIKVTVSFTDDLNNPEARTSAATAAVSAAPNTPATGAPAITGTAQVGQTLTADTTAIVDADGLTNVSYTYQWIRVDGGTETNIASATASTYTLVAADRGTTIKVTVSFTDDASNAETLTSAATAAVAAAPNTPATGAPTITGTAQVGQTLTAGTTAIMDADGLTSVSYTYQWIRVATDNTETNIASATASTHTLVAADQGTTIKVTVSFTDDASNAETLTSTATAAVSAAANTLATGAPTIIGTAQVGQTLTAGTTAIMDAEGLTTPGYTYQWIRVATDNTETNISGATASTHTLVAADQGKTVKVKVSFTDDASNAETLTSTATAAVSAAANTLATGAPTITGTATVGQTLTAVTTAIMDADGLTSVSYTYQWIRVATDNTETNIASATASTYTLVAADQGKTIKVTVSFTDDLNNPEARTSAATAAVSAAANTPATGAPAITGTAQVGQTLTADTTAIVDADGLTNVSYTYQWIRVDGGAETNIASATASTHTLVAADQGTTIKVTVSFTDDASNAETLTSAATAAVSAAPNTPATGAPTITGTAQVGQTLTAGTTAIMDADGLTSVSYTYQWIRVATDNTETNIASATASTYTLVAADQGKTIKVKVSFTDDASNAETLTSVATAAVSAAPNTPATGAPTITGTAQVGQTLTAGTTAIMDADGLTSVSYTYQWIRVDGGTETNIASATASTYTLVAADQGTTIKVTVSFTDDASNAETLTSAATAAVAAAPNTPATGAPTITGTAQVGQTLTAGTTAIMDADGLTSVSYTYQWIRVATDNTETNIASATASTYTLVAADQGTTIKVTVSFTDDASNAETLTSTATAAVSAAAEHPRDGRADDHRHGAGRADADGGHHRHHGCRRADQRQLHVPVDPGGHRQHRDEHRLGDGEHLHPGGGRPGHDDQGDGELHRRRQ